MKLVEASPEASDAGGGVQDIPDGVTGAFSEVPGNVWKIEVEEGAVVAEGDLLAIIESMKMEISVRSPTAGRVTSVPIKPGETLRAGDIVALIGAH
jgi:urea carboxylase